MAIWQPPEEAAPPPATPSIEREYIVTLEPGVDYVQFNQEMIASTGAGNIPQRSVDVAYAKPASKRITHYALTDEEAEALRNDTRVTDVELPWQEQEGIEIGHFGIQTGNFNKSASESGQYYDWGKIRHSIVENVYGIGTTTDAVWPYSLDGTGVDIVIQDSGLQADHPEFRDRDGNSRFVPVDWGQYGVSGFNQADHDRDFDGHGTHCGGTAAGLNFGWAKNARIHSVKVSGLEGTGDSGGISTNDCFDCIKLWHRAKPIDPVTGFKRPTIVNMSWGYGGGWTNTPTDVLYRGVTYNSGNDPAFNTGSTHIWDTYGIVPTGRINARLSYIDAEIEELLDEGIHVCIAAGNNYHYIDTSDGQDFNNIVFWSTGSRYYMRGSSPHSTSGRAFIVGNVESSPLDASTERKRGSSECGPGVTVWAAGSDIISCTSTTNKFADAPYFGNDIGEGYRQCNISGTSMASPQVCGIGALYLQAHPDWTPEQLQDRIIKDSLKGVMNDTGATSYRDTDNIMGGNNRLLFNRYNNSTPYSISGLSTTTDLKKR
jgi:subtilisin family serine protease